jgi:hypothetical protein
VIIYFAGAEQPWALKALRKAEARNVFMSYFYVPKRKPVADVLKTAAFPYPVRLMVDSGVFTLLEGMKHGTIGKVDFEEYAANYFAWLKANAQHITTCVNLDLDSVVGCKKVDEWNERYFSEIERLGIEVAYVWHKERGRADYLRFCRQYRYIAFSAMLDGGVNLSLVNSWVRKAGDYGTKVHGLAMTRWDALKRIPFYSVDSTTWLSGTRYGITALKHPTAPSMAMYGKNRKDEARKRWRGNIIRAGLDFEKITADNGAEVSAWFAKQVHDMNADVDRINPNLWYRGGRRDA